MKFSNIRNIIFLLLLWSCNEQKQDHTVQAVNDTAFLLNQALSNATSVRYMPDADAVIRPYRFKDSILLTSEVISLDLLPTSIDGHKFKIMPEKAILSELKADSNNLNLPNYLIVSRFEVNDSGYYLQIQNLSALPFGGGGSLGLYYVRKGDSLVNVEKTASSIN